MFCFHETFRFHFGNVGTQEYCDILDNSFWGIYSRSAKSSQPYAVILDRTEEGSLQLKLQQGLREQFQVRTCLCQRLFRSFCYGIQPLITSVLFK